jgi:hypothetical protein
MGAGGALDSPCAERRAQAFDRRARGSQRHLLWARHRLPVAGVAQRPAAQEYGAFLFMRWDWNGALERIH